MTDWLGVGLVTGAADRAEAEAAVGKAYALAGLTAPERIEWCGSPHAGAVAAAGATDRGRSVRTQVRTRPWATARSRIADRLGPSGWAAHWAQTGQRPWQLIVGRVVVPLRTQLGTDLPVAARSALLDAVYGQHDAAWLAAFDTAGELAGLAGVAQAAGWWWPYERVVVLSERPARLLRDNLGRLHSGDGPALGYPDGYAVHAWRGMPIPADFVTQLDTLTAARIHGETNAELRRVMLEHYGYERYLRESAAVAVQRDEYGVLWRVPIPDDEPLCMVEVRNATPEPDGSRRTYWLRVPPRMRSAREAVAWTFGLTAEEYAPTIQT